MDGIAFTTKLLEWNPDCRIIFMSGYMEIEYLKSAIRLAAEVKFPLGQSMHCIILQLPGKVEDKERKIEKAADIMRSSFCSALGSYYREKRQYEFILSYPEKDKYRLSSLYRKLLDEFPEARLGIGMDTGSYKNIYNSYKMACSAINCAFYQEKERLFQIDEGILQKNYIEPGIYGEFLQILAGHPQKLTEWFKELFAQLYQQKYYHKEQVYTLMISFLLAIYKKYPEIYGVDTGIWKEEELPAYVREMDFLCEIREFVEKLLECLKAKQEEQSGHGRIICGVIDYVAKHYGEEDLSVVQIAEHLHFSAVYLNVLFKQEMKMTLKQYLSYYRLEKAKQMLEQGYDKITEIAEKCGYANANYFAKVFREAAGMSPAEYRKEKGGR